MMKFDVSPKPPRAARKPHTLECHGDQREDPYYWLRDDERASPEVLAYLEEENRYAEAVLAPTAPLQQQLYEEMVARQKPDEALCPIATRATGM